MVSNPGEAAVQAKSETNMGLIVLITIVATLGGFLFGFDSGVINGTFDGLQAAFGSSIAGGGFNVASMLLGCAAGAFMAGWLADKFGRRTILLVAAVFFIISAWGSGIAVSAGEFVIYRLIGGFGVGAASVLAPAYISELAPAEYRGRLTTLQQIAIIVGLFSAFVSNYLLAEGAGGSMAITWMGFEAWRWMFWIELVPAVIFLVALLTIPESPRYLVLSGARDKAQAVLGKLFGSAAEKMAADIEASLASDHHKPRFSDLLDKTSGKVRKIVWVGIGLASFQQLVGINVVFYYGAVLWQAVGFSESDALLINIISAGLSIAACVVTVLLVDKIGRKPLLWVGSLGMAVTLSLVAFAFSTGTIASDGTLQLSDAMGTLALVAANLYVVFFNGSWGPVMWVMLGEMFPNQIRGSGLAVAGLFQWGTNFAITLSFPVMLVSIGLAGAYGFYAISAFISVWFVLKMVHETKGMTLEEMEG
jgi:MFS transporter, SP family, sugar:H+ symporter